MKIKSHSGAKKRVRISGSGIKSFKKSCKNHLLSNKSKRQKGLENVTASSRDRRALNQLLPN